MFDTVLDLKTFIHLVKEDFQPITMVSLKEPGLDLEFAKQVLEKILKRDLRIYVKTTNNSQTATRCLVYLSLYSPKLIGKDRILRCQLGDRFFNTLFLNDKNSRERKLYDEWVEKIYKEVEGAFGFKPHEGYWDSEG